MFTLASIPLFFNETFELFLACTGTWQARRAFIHHSKALWASGQLEQAEVCF
jgi:hypothetical protein